MDNQGKRPKSQIISPGQPGQPIRSRQHWRWERWSATGAASVVAVVGRCRVEGKKPRMSCTRFQAASAPSRSTEPGDIGDSSAFIVIYYWRLKLLQNRQLINVSNDVRIMSSKVNRSSPHRVTCCRRRIHQSGIGGMRGFSDNNDNNNNNHNTRERERC